MDATRDNKRHVNLVVREKDYRARHPSSRNKTMEGWNAAQPFDEKSAAFLIGRLSRSRHCAQGARAEEDERGRDMPAAKGRVDLVEALRRSIEWVLAGKVKSAHGIAWRFFLIRRRLSWLRCWHSSRQPQQQ